MKLHRYGRCTECGCTFRLRRDGTMRSHWYAGIRGASSWHDRCPGVGYRPSRWHWGSAWSPIKYAPGARHEIEVHG